MHVWSSPNVDPQTVVPSGRSTSVTGLSVPLTKIERSRTRSPAANPVTRWHTSSPGSSSTAVVGAPSASTGHPSGAGNRSTTSR